MRIAGAISSLLVVMVALVIRIRNRKKVHYPDAATLIITHPATAADARIVDLEGAANMRDLGGYVTSDGRSVKRGQVFRSARLSELTERDHATLADLGVKLVCDLRSIKEISTEPDHLPAAIAYHHLAINDDTPVWQRLSALVSGRPPLAQQLSNLYTDLFIDKNARIFGQTLRLLADENNRPAIFHCNAGKDRAGIVSALLLLILGVSEETVVADYSLSNRYYEHFRRMVAPRITRLGVFNVTVDDLYPLITADPVILRNALAHIRLQYGSIQDYLTGPAGLDMQTLERLRDSLLEEGNQKATDRL
jgi:protein-tyrosine phosphatase